MQLSTLFLNLGLIYLGIFLGFIIGRFSKKGEYFEKNLSYIITYILIPVLFINAITEQLGSASEIISLTLFSFIFPLILFTISIIATIKQKMPPKTKGAFILSAVFSNAIYLPIPIISAIIGVEGIVTVTIFATVQIILRTTLGTAISIYYSETVRTNLSKFIFNSILFPPLLATIVGFILFTFNFHFPTPFNLGTEFIGGLSIPLSIFTIGLSLSTLKLQSTNFRLVTMITLIQLLIAPIIGYFMLLPFSFSNVILRSMLIVVLMPPAISNIIYANVFELDTKLTSAAVIFSTIIFLIFLPVILILIPSV